MITITYTLTGSDAKYHAKFTNFDDALAWISDNVERPDMDSFELVTQEKISTRIPKVVENAYPDVRTMSQQELINALGDELSDIERLEESGKVYAVVTSGIVKDPRTPINEVLEAVTHET